MADVEISKLQPQSARVQLLSWLGVLGGAVTVFSNLQGIISLADWARFMVVNWTAWMGLIWGPLFQLLGFKVPEIWFGPLTFLAFAAVTAMRIRTRRSIGRGIHVLYKDLFYLQRLEDFKRIEHKLDSAAKGRFESEMSGMYSQLLFPAKLMRTLVMFSLFLLIGALFSPSLLSPDSGLSLAGAILSIVGIATIGFVASMIIRNAFASGLTVYWWSASITEALLKTIALIVALIVLNEVSKLGLEQYLVAPKVPS